MKGTKIMSALIVLSSLATGLEAKTCLRCQKIEAEREEEQAKHPQKAGYYDDLINIHSNEKTSDESQRKNLQKDDKLIGWVGDYNSEKDSNSAQQLETRIQSDDLQNPGMREEIKATERARAHYEELTKQNRDMIQKDRSMTKESYDPNEGYGGFKSSDLNKAAPNQEEVLRGETGSSPYAPQGWK